MRKKNKKKQTVALIKPDGVMKNAVEEIQARYQRAGLVILSEHRFRFTEEYARRFYVRHEGKCYFEGLILAMTSGEIVAFLLEGDSNVVDVVRRLNGATDPREAEPGTIRRDFRSAGGPFNTVHGSDSVEEAEREWAIVLEAVT